METPIPFENLGTRLKRLREQHKESLAEVSGAVEIDETSLTRIETGHERPSEDILLLLISHFAVEDDMAAELWQMAGYDKPGNEEREIPPAGNSNNSRQQTMMIMIDPRVMYSDNVEVLANNEGVILNFSQTAGQNAQPLTVSRMGMSHHQAKLLLGVLHQALYEQENPPRRQLGDGNSD